MSFLSRLFGSKKRVRPGQGGLDDRLASLEAEAESARPGYQGTPYNKAGDLALREGDDRRAVVYYGRAIDAFLEDAQREAARGVANKIIRVHPKAVRTLCTLTWLDLASQHGATALLHLRDYVEAAKEVGENVRAAEQVYDMARLSAQSEFLDAAADALDSLGFDARASEVRAWVGSGGSDDALAVPAELAKACIAAAVSSNSGAEQPAEGEASEEGPGADPGTAEEVGGAEDVGDPEAPPVTEAPRADLLESSASPDPDPDPPVEPSPAEPEPVIVASDSEDSRELEVDAELEPPAAGGDEGRRAAEGEPADKGEPAEESATPPSDKKRKKRKKKKKKKRKR